MVAEFNTEYWPIVYLRFGGKVVDDDVFEEYQKFYLNLLIKCKKNNEKMVLISDLSHINSNNNLPMKYFMRQIQFSKKIYDFNKKYLKGVVILCKSKSFKNLIQSLMSFTKQAAPNKICRSYKKANLYLLEKFNIKFNVEIFNKEKELNIDDENEDNEENEDNSQNDDINNIIKDIDLENNNDTESENSKKKVFTEYFNELSL
jgi:hypothetical protein